MLQIIPNLAACTSLKEPFIIYSILLPICAHEKICLCLFSHLY